MLNLNNASQSVGPDGNRIEKPRRQPLREHELFGLPKSTVKPERPKLEPIRLKDFFESPKSKKTTKTVRARRTTTMPFATSNTGKKLHHGQNTPVAVSATSAFTYNKTSGLSNLQGLSKSDGKINKTKGLGHERLQSETMKKTLKVWEASQTVQPSARKSRPAEARGHNVRRNLDSVFHSSPVAMPKHGCKSVAQKIEAAESKPTEAEARRSVKPPFASRKSCLPPPNSIRDRYVIQRQNETIREESTLSISIENESRNWESENIDAATEISKVSENRESENSDEREGKKAPQGISRPTVIVERSAKVETEKKDDEFDDILPLPIPRPPLQELHQNASLPRTKSDSNTPLPEDRGESFCDNLPQNSFLEFTHPAKDSWIKMDLQTLSWIHGNLKLTIRTSEEQLFTMRRMLKVIEDAMKNRDVEAKINGEPEAEIVSEIEINAKIADSVPEIPFVPEERKIEASTEDRATSIVEDLVDENKENRGESPRRRSARLAEKSCKTPKSRDDSFSQYEHELDIVHASTKKNSKSPLPAKAIKTLDPRSRKSIREYMALKSSMNFLATPDVKGFATPMGEKDTPLHRKVTRRSLSRKLLSELDELYADSPS